MPPLIKNIDITARQTYTIEIKICDDRTATVSCAAWPIFDKPFKVEGVPSTGGDAGRIRFIGGPNPFFVDEWEYSPGDPLDCYATENLSADSVIGVRYPQLGESLVVTAVAGSEGLYRTTVSYGVSFDPNDAVDKATYDKTLWKVGEATYCPRPRKYAYEVTSVTPGSAEKNFLAYGHITMLIKPTQAAPTTAPTACSVSSF